MSLCIALCAGETSGDQLGAGLIHALRERYPQATFVGIGGPLMRAAGMETWWDANELAVMGLVEVLRHLPRLLRLRKAFRQRVLDTQPDVFIGIDAPDFNLSVERWLKQRGVRTVHYVSPSIWAWRQGRAEKIGRSADRVLCLFPMEPPIYARHGVDARFIGHPLADAIALQPDRNAARNALNQPQDAPILALLPGSRLGEIHGMLPDFANAAQRLAGDIPNLRILVPAANAQCREAIHRHLGSDTRFTIFDGQAQRIMIASDVVLLASGTAALEAMLCKRPMVVGHRISALTYRIVKLFGLLKSRFVSLPNVLANEALIPELLQEQCTPGNLHAALKHWFTDTGAAQALQPRFAAIHQQLRCDASQRAADAVAELIPTP